MKRAILCLLIAAALTACSAETGASPAPTKATASPSVAISPSPTAEEPTATPEEEPSPTPEATLPDELATEPVNEPTEEPVETDPGEPTAAPEPELFEVKASLLYFRSEAEINPKNVIALIPKGMKVRKLDDAEPPFVYVEAADGHTGYCASQYLKKATDDKFPMAVAFAYVTPASYTTKDDAGNDVTLKDNLVDVRKVDPTLQINMIFATPDNFTGEVLYPKSYCLLQKETAAKLKAAQALFQKDGYCIKVYDAYRPHSVQVKLWNIVKDSRYIAKPEGRGSMHNHGAAVDMTLVDKNGVELEMPSPMHTMNQTSHRSYKGMSAKAKQNMEYMATIMKKAGFKTITTEWWHFEDHGKEYPLTDYDFNKIYPIYEFVK